jgi:hypothetical protein
MKLEGANLPFLGLLAGLLVSLQDLLHSLLAG